MNQDTIEAITPNIGTLCKKISNRRIFLSHNKLIFKRLIFLQELSLSLTIKLQWHLLTISPIFLKCVNSLTFIFSLLILLLLFFSNLGLRGYPYFLSDHILEIGTLLHR